MALELRPLMQKNDDEMTYTITLRALSAWLQKMRWDDKIASFKEYAGNSDSATFDESDVLAQLEWNSHNPKKIGSRSQLPSPYVQHEKAVWGPEFGDE